MLDVLRQIASFLPQRDLCRARLVSHEFYQACDNIIISVKSPEDVPEIGLIKVRYSAKFAPFKDRIAVITSITRTGHAAAPITRTGIMRLCMRADGDLQPVKLIPG